METLPITKTLRFVSCLCENTIAVLTPDSRGEHNIYYCTVVQVLRRAVCLVELKENTVACRKTTASLEAVSPDIYLSTLPNQLALLVTDAVVTPWSNAFRGEKAGCVTTDESNNDGVNV